MIRRSTLVFLTCLAALGTPAIRAKSAAATEPLPAASPVLIAQASGGSAINSNLDINSRGEAVKLLQLRLQQGDFYTGLVDGIYGLGTQRAVRAFQADAGLPETGVLDEETWRQIRNAIPTQSAGGAGGSPDVVSDLPTVPATAPTASELPADSGADATADVVEGEAGGLGRIFGLSLGLVAVVASFGVGFFIANRDKSSGSDSDEWGELEPSENSALAASTLTGGLNVGGLNSAQNMEGGAIAPTAGVLSNSGQMGGTTPLAKVDVIDGLIGDLRNSDPARRRKAIWELGQRGNSLAMQPLVDSMVDADSKEKSLVLAALSEIGIRSLKPMSRALAIALQDDNPEVRKNAIRDLTRVYELVVQISQMLGHATEDEDPEVRQTATWALEQLNRIRRSQDIDANVRSFGSSGKSIDAADRFAL